MLDLYADMLKWVEAKGLLAFKQQKYLGQSSLISLAHKHTRKHTISLCLSVTFTLSQSLLFARSLSLCLSLSFSLSLSLNLFLPLPPSPSLYQTHAHTQCLFSSHSYSLTWNTLSRRQYLSIIFVSPISLIRLLFLSPSLSVVTIFFPAPSGLDMQHQWQSCFLQTGLS